MHKPYYMYGFWFCNGIQFPTEEDAWEYYRESEDK